MHVTKCVEVWGCLLLLEIIKNPYRFFIVTYQDIISYDTKFILFHLEGVKARYLVAPPRIIKENTKEISITNTWNIYSKQYDKICQLENEPRISYDLTETSSNFSQISHKKNPNCA